MHVTHARRLSASEKMACYFPHLATCYATGAKTHSRMFAPSAHHSFRSSGKFYSSEGYFDDSSPLLTLVTYCQCGQGGLKILLSSDCCLVLDRMTGASFLHTWEVGYTPSYINQVISLSLSVQPSSR